MLHELQGKPISRRDAIFKAVEDKSIGAIALLLFAPTLLVIAIAAKLDSKGSVFLRQRRRHVVKPGLTGWAELHGMRGPPSDPELMRKRAELDLFYLQHWSIWIDIKVLTLTPLFGFAHKNAL